jgi:hypothetical protein
MEQDARLERPPEVTVALHLLYIGLGFMAATGILECSVPWGKPSEGLGMLGTLPLAAVIYYMIGKGKNWARIAFSILCIAGIPLNVAEFWRHPPTSGWLDFSRVSLQLAEMSVDLAALVILFQRASSGWFRAISGPQSNPLKNMFTALRNTDRPILSYVWRAWLIAFIPTMLIAPVVQSAMPDKVPSFDGPIVITVLGVLVLSPWAETLLMIPILWILKRTTGETLWIAVASAVVWGLLHSALAPAWGFAVTWPFFVFSLCFLEWEKKSRGNAIKVTAMVHMCHNMVPALVLALSALFGAESPPQQGLQPADPPSRLTVKEMPSGETSVLVVSTKKGGHVEKEDKYRIFLRDLSEFGRKHGPRLQRIARSNY